MRATPQGMVGVPRTGEVHMPHKALSIYGPWRISIPHAYLK